MKMARDYTPKGPGIGKIGLLFSILLVIYVESAPLRFRFGCWTFEYQSSPGRTPCDEQPNIVINEIHSNDANGEEKADFIELRQLDYKPGTRQPLTGYYLIQISVPENEESSPQITMVSDLDKFAMMNEYFVIGGMQVENANIHCDDNSVKFTSQLKTGSLDDFVMNGDQTPIGIGLIYSIDRLNFLKLTKAKPSVPILPNMELKLNKVLKDLVVFGRTAYTQSCQIFERLHSNYKNKDYMLRELNLPNEKQFSLNRCTIRAEGFIPDSFKIGVPSPNAENQCDLTHYKFDDRLIQITPNLISNRLIPELEQCPSNIEPHILSGVDPNLVVEDMQSVAKRSKEDVCNIQMRGSDENKRNAALTTIVERATEMNYEPDFDWNTQTHFNVEWLDLFDEKYPDLMPIGIINKSDEIKNWFVFLEDKGSYKCRLCADFYDKFRLNQKNKPELAKENGFEISKNKETNRDMIRKHYSLASHTAVIAQLKEITNNNILEWFSQKHKEEEIENKVFAATSRFARTVYTAILTNTPFNSFRYLIELQKMHGVNLGNHYHNHEGMKQMMTSMSNKMQSILLKELLENDLPFSLIMDTSVDLNKNHYLTVLIQTLEHGYNPIVYFWRLIKIGSDETAQGIFNVLIKNLETDGLIDYLKGKLASYNTDGAATFIGREGGIRELLKKYVKPKIFFSNHCMNHRLELALHHAMKEFDWFPEFEAILNKIHTFYYSGGSKRITFLRDMSIDMKIKFYELHYLYKIRWVASDYRVILNIRHMWYLLAKNLEAIINSPNFDKNSKTQAIALLAKIKDKKFVILLHFNHDILSSFMHKSKEFQKKGGSIIGKGRLIRNLLDNIISLELNDGVIVKDFLKAVKCNEVSPCTLEDYETEDVKWNDILLTEAETFPYLSVVRKPLAEQIVIELNSYFPDITTEYALKLSDFDIFDPENMPNIETSIPNYGVDSIKSIHSFFKFNCSLEILLADWIQLLNGILMKEDKRCEVQDLPPHQYWSAFLKIDEIWTDCTKLLIQTVLVIPVGSSDAERSFSILNYVNKLRYLLKPGRLDEYLRIRINGPKHLALFRSLDYAKYWIDIEKHNRVDDPGKAVDKIEPFPFEELQDVYFDQSNIF